MQSTTKKLPRGLTNNSNCCWANAVVQAILHTWQIFDALTSDSHKSHCKKSPCVRCQLQELAIESLKDNQTAMDSQSLMSTVSITSDLFAFGDFGDSHEFFIYLLDYLNDVAQIYNHSKFLTLRCPSCKHSTNKQEGGIEFEIPVKSGQNLTKAFKSHFARTIADYQCEDCDKDVEVSHQFRLVSTPEVLVIVVKRQQKEEKKVKFDIQMDIGPATSSKAPCEYSLFAMIVFQPNGDEGHFYAIVKNSQWCKIDDQVATVLTERQVLGNTGGLMFFYSKTSATATHTEATQSPRQDFAVAEEPMPNDKKQIKGQKSEKEKTLPLQKSEAVKTYKSNSNKKGNKGRRKFNEAHKSPPVDSNKSSESPQRKKEKSPLSQEEEKHGKLGKHCLAHRPIVKVKQQENAEAKADLVKNLTRRSSKSRSESDDSANENSPEAEDQAEICSGEASSAKSPSKTKLPEADKAANSDENGEDQQPEASKDAEKEKITHRCPYNGCTTMTENPYCWRHKFAYSERPKYHQDYYTKDEKLADYQNVIESMLAGNVSESVKADPSYQRLLELIQNSRAIQADRAKKGSSDKDKGKKDK
jgi:ubiquitin C-terminal hydrolase